MSEKRPTRHTRWGALSGDDFVVLSQTRWHLRKALYPLYPSAQRRNDCLVVVCTLWAEIERTRPLLHAMGLDIHLTSHEI